MTSFTSRQRQGSLEHHDQPCGLPAELTLRFGTERIHGRLRWPQPPADPESAPLIVLLADPSDPNGAEMLSGMLCSAATAVVLTIAASGSSLCEGGTDRGLQLAALGWAAEHASELCANPARLSIAGMRGGGGHAAWLAISARDNAWPHVRRQLLVHPTFATAGGMPLHVAGVAPATIVTSGALNTDGRGYAARLDAAGVGVKELRCAEHEIAAGHQSRNLARLPGSDSPAGLDQRALQIKPGGTE